MRSSQRHHPDPARGVYEFAATGLRAFPVPELGEHRTAVITLSRLLDELGRKRSLLLGASAINAAVEGAKTADELSASIAERWRGSDEIRERMVALQEELDWIAYVVYGLVDNGCLTPLRRYIDLTCPRGSRPFERQLGRSSTVRAGGRALTLEEGEAPPVGALPAWAEEIWLRRETALKSSDQLRLIETPVFKRAWRDTDQNVAEPEYRCRKDADDLQRWLSRQIEEWASQRDVAFGLAQLVAALQDRRGIMFVAEALAGRRDFSLEALATQILVGDSVPQHRFHTYTDAGLAKRSVWEDAWRLQRLEDAGEKVSEVPLPPEYSQGSRGKSTDFLRTEYWHRRGKFDVPREAFIAFTEVPGRAGIETLYGWRGWTATQRLRAILLIDEELEDAAVPLGDRIGLLDSAWRLLPDVARDDAAAATRLRAELQALVGPEGPSRELIEDWKRRFPPPTTRATRTKKAAAARDDDGEDGQSEESDES